MIAPTISRASLYCYHVGSIRIIVASGKSVHYKRKSKDFWGLFRLMLQSHEIEYPLAKRPVAAAQTRAYASKVRLYSSTPKMPGTTPGPLNRLRVNKKLLPDFPLSMSQS